MQVPTMGLLPVHMWADRFLEAVGLKNPYEKVEKLPMPPRTAPAAPTAAELRRMQTAGDWSRWTPDIMYERTMEQARIGREAWEQGMKQGAGGEGPYIGSADTVDCSWYEHFDRDEGQCVFGSTALWLLGGTAVFLLLMAAMASAGATAGLRISGAVIDR